MDRQCIPEPSSLSTNVIIILNTNIIDTGTYTIIHNTHIHLAGAVFVHEGHLQVPLQLPLHAASPVVELLPDKLL